MTAESEPLQDLLRYPNVALVPLAALPVSFQTNNRLLFLVSGPMKVAFQIGSLFTTLAYTIRSSDWLIVQVCGLSVATQLNPENSPDELTHYGP